MRSQHLLKQAQSTGPTRISTYGLDPQRAIDW